MTPGKQFCRAVPFPWIQAAPGTHEASAHQSKAGLQGKGEEKANKRSDKRYINNTLYLEIVEAVEWAK